MNLIAFSIYDAKLNAFSPPFFLNTVPQALRAFGEHVNTPGELINKHPEDFSLHQIGTFDTENAHIDSADRPIALLANAKDFWHETPSNQLDITDAINRKLREKKGA